MMSSNIVKVIRPTKGMFDLDLGEIWAYRELLYFLAWKQVKIRYKQTAMGAAWAIIQPLATMLIFTFVFGDIAGMPSDGVPYPIFSYTGLILWTYFSASLSGASMSLVSNANLLSKIYFPRILLPLSSVVVGLLDYAIASVILVGLMIYYGIMPSFLILLSPIPLVLAGVLSSGLGFWLSAVSVKYRDVQYAVPFFIQLLLFISPIIYPVTVGGGKYAWLLNLNPLTGIMTMQRAVILGNTPIDWVSVGIASLLTVVIFLGGLVYFKNYEREFADVI